MSSSRKLVLAALLLACCVVVLGAYVRLADAGLGCPDWPGCYGQLSPLHAADAIAAAEAQAPHGPVSMPKAWKEMGHRYLAMLLGLLILWIAWRALRLRSPELPRRVALLLVVVVIAQGLLGKWTVTLLLKPAIVTAHLIGGMSTVALLAWLAMHGARWRRIEVAPGTLRWARCGLLVLALQIVLGGWTSTNYAALACSDLPRCQGSWLPTMDFANAFHVLRELGMTAQGELLSLQALTAIHWAHRAGALLATAVLGGLVCCLLLRRESRSLALLLGAALSLQLGLGVANVHWSLPLPLAVAHNAGALLLLLVVLAINFRLQPERGLLLVRRGVHANFAA